ncbi:MAG: cation acetate symporter, partial [Candidatus Cloacimonetes bacterium]|nr:cation acetate symporter [Candidatus Cloacimonadota bacterium]
FPAIILGIFDKRMNKEGAITGMIIGLGLMILYMLKFKFGIFDGGKEAVAGLESNWFLGISPEGFGTIAMLVNFAVSLVISRMTAAPPEEIQQIVEDIRIPSGAADAIEH